MGVRELSKRSRILPGVLQNAERRDTLEHFTIAQIRRLGAALDMNLFDVLTAQDDANLAGESRADALSELSDTALTVLAEAFDFERETGYSSELANTEPPRPEISELLKSGAMQISAGRVVISPEISSGLAHVSKVPQMAERVAKFSQEISARITSLRV